MHSTKDDDRAEGLATEALKLSGNGRNEQAAKRLREALSLAPDNPNVTKALQSLDASQGSGHLLQLCRQYVSENAGDAADEMLAMLQGGQFRSSHDAVASLRMILDKDPSRLSSKQDQLIAKLVLSNTEAREFLAAKFQDSSSTTFEDLFDRGDESVNCLRAITLNASSWKSEEIQSGMKRDLLQLLLAKLMESGQDHDGRALKNIALLLAADADHLSSLIDEDSFDSILSCLDLRSPDDVRSQATLAISKFLEVSQELGQRYFTNFIVSKIQKQRKDDTVVVFSAAAALFPIATTMTASLFLTDGFLPSLMPYLDGPLKSPGVTNSFLKLLNAASMDITCRTAIDQYCSNWLCQMVGSGTNDQTAIAATVLAKIRTGGVQKDGKDTMSEDTKVDDLVDLFKYTLRSSSSSSVATSIEGLAYTSLKPEVKDSLSGDRSILASIFRHVEQNLSNPEIVIGGLSIISNLTQYQPNLTDEQRKIAELKAYANTSKLPSLNPLNDEKHVTARCSAVIEAGVLPLLIECNRKSKSASTKLLTSNILLSLSKESKARGKIAQQGAVKLLLQIVNATNASTTNGNGNSTTHPAHYFPASHALARILISTNPSHVFPSSGNPSAVSAIRPLISLLIDDPSTDPPTSTPSAAATPIFTPSSTQPRTLLPVFESLLALTNLASIPSPTTPSTTSTPVTTPSTLLLRLAFPQISDLLLSTHPYLQRAATELICNLISSTPEAIALYADTEHEPQAKNRLHLLLALCDVDDLPTRKAAGGALAVLTEFSTVVAAILERDRGTEILLSMVSDEDGGDEIKHRGVVCVRNMLFVEDEDLAKDVVTKVREADGVEILKELLKECRDQSILEVGVMALKKIMN